MLASAAVSGHFSPLGRLAFGLLLAVGPVHQPPSSRGTNRNTIQLLSGRSVFMNIRRFINRVSLAVVVLGLAGCAPSLASNSENTGATIPAAKATNSGKPAVK